MKSCLWFSMFCLMTPYALGQTPGAEVSENAGQPLVIREAMSNKAITAIRVQPGEGPPVIDGVLDESVWRSNTPYEGLHQTNPVEFAPGTELTRFWVAYDEDHLYVAAQVYDDPSLVVALQPVQGREFESDDQLHISLDPFNTDRDGYFFQTNPNGLRREALISNVAFNPHWRAIWDAGVRRNAEGWAVEMAIPFKSLSFDPRNTVWGFNIGRVIRRKGEFQVWSSRGRDTWEMGPTVMADLSPIAGVRQGRGLDIQVTGVASHVYQQGLGTDTGLEPSLDMFYKPMPSVTLAATLNTDFSSTEVDDRIVNLSRFDAQLPEKRDFFLRDSNQFTFAGLADNGMPFFSRRIGLSEDGQALPIDAGLKFFGRFGEYDVGSMLVRQEVSDPAREHADLLVVRMKRNVLQESELGFIYTQGNPLADEENRVWGLDVNYNRSDAWGLGRLRGAAWYQQVEQDESPEDNHALGFILGLTRNSYDIFWNYREIGEHFNPALGFVNRRDIRHHHINASRSHYFNEGWLKSSIPRLSADYVSDTRNLKQSYQMDITPLALESVGGDKLSLMYSRSVERLDEHFSPVPAISVQPGDYDADLFSLMVSSSIARPFHASAEWRQGDFYGGDRFDQLYSLGWRPWRTWYVTLGYDMAALDTPGGEFTTRLTRAGSELAINRDWAWLLLAQYDNVTRQLGVSSRLRWIPRAGQELALVVNNLHERLEDGGYQTLVDDYRLKLAYTFRY